MDVKVVDPLARVPNFSFLLRTKNERGLKVKHFAWENKYCNPVVSIPDILYHKMCSSTRSGLHFMVWQSDAPITGGGVALVHNEPIFSFEGLPSSAKETKNQFDRKAFEAVIHSVEEVIEAMEEPPHNSLLVEVSENGVWLYERWYNKAQLYVEDVVQLQSNLLAIRVAEEAYPPVIITYMWLAEVDNVKHVPTVTIGGHHVTVVSPYRYQQVHHYVIPYYNYTNLDLIIMVLKEDADVTIAHPEHGVEKHKLSAGIYILHHYSNQIRNSD